MDFITQTLVPVVTAALLLVEIRSFTRATEIEEAAETARVLAAEDQRRVRALLSVQGEDLRRLREIVAKLEIEADASHHREG